MAVVALAAVAILGGCGSQPSTGPSQAPSLAPIGAAAFNVRGTAAECPSTGGCGYFLELERAGRHQRVSLSAFAGDVGPDEPVTSYELELAAGPFELEPGAYSVTLASITYSDSNQPGEPGRESALAACFTRFVVDPGLDRAVILTAAFSGRSCTGATQFLDFANQPPYELTCGPIETDRCEEHAEDAARAALLHYPEAHVISITFSSGDGDMAVVLDNGVHIGRTVN